MISWFSKSALKCINLCAATARAETLAREVYGCDPTAIADWKDSAGNVVDPVTFGALWVTGLEDQLCLNYALSQRDGSFQPGAGPLRDAEVTTDAAHAVARFQRFSVVSHSVMNAMVNTYKPGNWLLHYVGAGGSPETIKAMNGALVASESEVLAKFGEEMGSGTTTPTQEGRRWTQRGIAAAAGSGPARCREAARLAAVDVATQIGGTHANRVKTMCVLIRPPAPPKAPSVQAEQQELGGAPREVRRGEVVVVGLCTLNQLDP